MVFLFEPVHIHIPLLSDFQVIIDAPHHRLHACNFYCITCTAITSD